MSQNPTSVAVVALFAALAVPLHLNAQHTRYKLIDIGTLGGPSGYKSVNAPGYQIINHSEVIAASGDTTTPDPNAPNLCYFPDCFVAHATRWKNGVLTDLGSLPGAGNGSASGAINARGWIAGQSQNGAIDPVSGLPETRAVLWTDDQIIDLGTFGGNWSLATTLNNRGQVVGFATNSIPDPFSLFIGGTQARGFLFQSGVMQDLGTLGGPDALALYVNQRGQVAGIAYTNAIPNPTTGIPTLHPFVWDHGKMTDLGTLGGSFAGGFAPDGAEGSLIINESGQVIGLSTLAGDQTYHPFLWDHGTLTDLGTLGGDSGTAIWLTETGEVVGEADLPNSPPGCTGLLCIHHGFLWKRGVMTDLGTLGTDPCSRALMMNSKGQIVGTTIAVCGAETTHPFLWENGGPMVDLNTLIPQESGAVLYEADNINERGEIIASGLPAGCDDRFVCGRVFLLIPCDANDASGCEGAAEGDTAAVQDSSALVTNNTTASTHGRSTPGGIVAWRSWLAQRYHISGTGTPKD